MTTDIVERLRSKSTDCHVSEEALWREAADEIERLRAQGDVLFASIKSNADEIERLRAEVAKLHDALDRMVNPKVSDSNISVRVEKHAKRDG